MYHLLGVSQEQSRRAEPLFYIFSGNKHRTALSDQIHTVLREAISQVAKIRREMYKKVNISFLLFSLILTD